MLKIFGLIWDVWLKFKVRCDCYVRKSLVLNNITLKIFGLVQMITFCPLGHFVPWDLLSLGLYVPGTFCPLGRFVPWDVLSLGRFVPGTFCPWDVLSWDVLYVHLFFEVKGKYFKFSKTYSFLQSLRFFKLKNLFVSATHACSRSRTCRLFVMKLLKYTWSTALCPILCPKSLYPRVGHSVLFRLVRYILFRS